MRLRRMLAEGVGYYHVISRIAGQQFLVDDREKDVLMRLMFNVAVFSGVEILTFALMDNHFHILVKVPKAREVDDDELVEVTPLSIRLRKKELDPTKRQRATKG